MALKYNALNLCHGTPSLTLPEFLIENMQKTVAEGPNNNYTTFAGHPLLREAIAENFAPYF